VIEMDGFVIELEVDADEQLMVSREEPYKPPDYSGGARCIICMSVFSEITEAVSHIQNARHTGRSSSSYAGRREASEGRISCTLPRRHQDLSHGEGSKAEKAEVAQDV